MTATTRVIFLLLCFDLLGGHEIQKIYVKRVTCSVNPRYIQSNYSCYAKSFNRSCSTATVMVTFKSSYQPVYVISVLLLVIFGKS